jgi:hypothetical protein
MCTVFGSYVMYTIIQIFLDKFIDGFSSILPLSNYVHYFCLRLRNGDSEFTALGILISVLHEHHLSCSLHLRPVHSIRMDHAAMSYLHRDVVILSHGVIV